MWVQYAARTKVSEMQCASDQVESTKERYGNQGRFAGDADINFNPTPSDVSTYTQADKVYIRGLRALGVSADLCKEYRLH